MDGGDPFVLNKAGIRSLVGTLDMLREVVFSRTNHPIRDGEGRSLSLTMSLVASGVAKRLKEQGPAFLTVNNWIMLCDDVIRETCARGSVEGKQLVTADEFRGVANVAVLRYLFISANRGLEVGTGMGSGPA